MGEQSIAPELVERGVEHVSISVGWFALAYVLGMLTVIGVLWWGAL